MSRIKSMKTSVEQPAFSDSEEYPILGSNNRKQRPITQTLRCKVKYELIRYCEY